MRLVAKVIMSEEERSAFQEVFCILDEASFYQQLDDAPEIKKIAERIADDIETLLNYHSD